MKIIINILFLLLFLPATVYGEVDSDSDYCNPVAGDGYESSVLFCDIVNSEWSSLPPDSSLPPAPPAPDTGPSPEPGPEPGPGPSPSPNPDEGKDYGDQLTKIINELQFSNKADADKDKLRKAWFDRCIHREGGFYKLRNECSGETQILLDIKDMMTEKKESIKEYTDNCFYRDAQGNYKLRPGCVSVGTGDGIGEDYTSIIDGIGSKLDAINKTLEGLGTGSGDGSGDGDGKDYTTNIDNLGTKLDDIKKVLEGDEEPSLSETKGVIDSGITGDGEGRQTLEDGSKEHESFLSELIGSSEISKIENHSYILTSSPVCSVDSVVFGQPFSIDFCPYEGSLNILGTLLLGIISIFGVVMVLRG